jgi:cytochrome P450
VAERYPAGSSTSSEKEPILPSTEPKVVSQPDLLSKFMQAKVDRPEFFNDQLVTTMAVSMAFAGSETTAISLSSVFYYLLKNPRCMDELLKELDDKGREGHFKDNENGVVTWTESQGLPYLDACVKEAFRLHPAPGLPLERVVPPQGAEIAGHFVKGGTIVGCSAWVIHRRPEIFGSDVEVYRPERWLVDESMDRDSEEKRIKEMTGTMLHFGMGARTCIGKNISLLEIYKLVPTVLRKFEVCSVPLSLTSFAIDFERMLILWQVRLEDPSKDWTVWNAWFVRQLNFRTVFHQRDIVQPTKA